jgi:hypothetical protein
MFLIIVKLIFLTVLTICSKKYNIQMSLDFCFHDILVLKLFLI